MLVLGDAHPHRPKLEHFRTRSRALGYNALGARYFYADLCCNFFRFFAGGA